MKKLVFILLMACSTAHAAPYAPLYPASGLDVRTKVGNTTLGDIAEGVANAIPAASLGKPNGPALLDANGNISGSIAGDASQAKVVVSGTSYSLSGFLGSTLVAGDLQPYLTIEAANATFATTQKLSDYLLQSDAASLYVPTATLGLYSTTAQANGMYAQKSDISGLMSKTQADATYATKAALEGFVPYSEIQSTYATQNALASFQDTVASTYATKQALSGYATKDYADATYLTTASLTPYLTQDQASTTYLTASALSDYQTIADASATYATKDSLSGYATTADLKGYATTADLTGFVSTADFDAKAAQFVSIDTLAAYLTKDAADKQYQAAGNYVAGENGTATNLAIKGGSATLDSAPTFPTQALGSPTTVGATTQYVDSYYNDKNAVVSGDISVAKSSINLVIPDSGGLTMSFTGKGSGYGQMFFSAASDPVVADVRRDTIYSGGGVETWTQDSYTFTTTQVSSDDTIYLASNDYSVYKIGVNGHLFTVMVWASGAGKRAYLSLTKLL